MYEIGDKVELNPSSQYYGLSGQIPREGGRVIRLNDCYDMPIRVAFKPGFISENVYKVSDLLPQR